MSTLKVNKIRDNSGSTDAIVLDPSGGAVLAGVTTVSTVKVGSGVTISSDGDVFTTGITTSSSIIVGSGVTITESGIEASGIGITCANINGAQIGGRRNLIINGAMQVAQRSTSYTGTDSFGSVDRVALIDSGTDENPTQAQADVASGTTPYTLGFRKSFKVTNGNNTSGAGTGDYISIRYRVEAQDVAQSGWNYTSSSSFITLSFWVKSSVAQNFYGRLLSQDGSPYSYPFETGSLTADTWTKVVKTIPGNSNITVTNDNGTGLQLHITPFWGTNYTDNGVTLNQWGAHDGSARVPDYTTTWYTTNDATFEITGLQLEVGSQATVFEHLSYGEELALCQRYFYMAASGADSSDATVAMCLNYSATSARAFFQFPVTMRTIPDIYSVEGTNYFKIFQAGGTTDLPDSIHGGNERPNMAEMAFEDDVAGMTVGQASLLRLNNAAARIGFTAEL